MGVTFARPVSLATIADEVTSLQTCILALAEEVAAMRRLLERKEGGGDPNKGLT